VTEGKEGGRGREGRKGKEWKGEGEGRSKEGKWRVASWFLGMDAPGGHVSAILEITGTC